MRVYLDNSATTPVDPEVVEAMLPYLTEQFGNASSVHAYGQKAKAAVDRARRQVADLIGATPPEVTFVSGGTEADNLAIKGIAHAHSNHGRHLVTTSIEHSAVLNTCDSLEKEGFEITRVPVSSRGLVSATAIREAIRADTILVAVMLANNELGTIQPVAEIGAIVRELRESRKHLHFLSDAVQAAGKIPVDVNELGVDLLSISGHKIHAPKGTGALYVRKGVRLAPLFHGGHHERDRRAGTENVPGIVALGKAAEIAKEGLAIHMPRVRELRDKLERGIIERIPGVEVNGDHESRIPNVLNMSFRHAEGEALLISLDLEGVAVSTGSACQSGSIEPSHVIQALHLPRDLAHGTLRFSLSKKTTEEEIDYVLETLPNIVEKLRKMAPAHAESANSPLEAGAPRPG